jgi:hypothetical protein
MSETMRITAKQLEEFLVRHDLIQEPAVEDPEGYDGYATVERINRLATALDGLLSEHESLHQDFSPACVVTLLNEIKDFDVDESHALCCLLNCLLYLGRQDVVEAYHEASGRCLGGNIIRRKFRVWYAHGGPLLTLDDEEDAIRMANELAAGQPDVEFAVTSLVERVVDQVMYVPAENDDEEGEISDGLTAREPW